MHRLRLSKIAIVNFIKFKYPANLIYGADLSGTFADVWNCVFKVDNVGP